MNAKQANKMLSNIAVKASSASPKQLRAAEVTVAAIDKIIAIESLRLRVAKHMKKPLTSKFWENR